MQEKFKALVWESLAFQESPGDIEALWDCCSEPLYSLEDKKKQLGLGEKVKEEKNKTFFLQISLRLTFYYSLLFSPRGSRLTSQGTAA